MALLGDEAQMEVSFRPFGDSANLNSRWVHSLLELLGDVGHVESHLCPLEIVLVSVLDRSIICTKRTIVSEIVLDAPDGTPR
jgi:hypothetical protein